MKNILLGIGCIVTFASSGQTWESLDGGIGIINAMAEYKGNLYVGGTIDVTTPASIQNIAMWDGSSWSPVGTGLSEGVAYTMAVYNDELYVGGDFSSAGGVASPYIAKWNGTNWSVVGTGLGGAVNALTVFNGALYAGGLFGNRFAAWDGSNWTNPMPLLNGYVDGIGVYNNELYVSGEFNNLEGIDSALVGIAQWTGTGWAPLGQGLTFTTGNIFIPAITQYNNMLYAGGNFTMAGGSPITAIAEWNGTNWTSVGSGLSNSDDIFVQAMLVFNNELYVGGRFSSAGGVAASNIAKWDGNNWSALGAGANDNVYAIGTYNNNLYMGGSFGYSGTNSDDGIAELNLTATGINKLTGNHAINIFPNPCDGQFTIGGYNNFTEIKVADEMGVTVYESRQVPSSFFLQGVANGMYFITLTSSEQRITEKVLINK